MDMLRIVGVIKPPIKKDKETIKISLSPTNYGKKIKQNKSSAYHAPQSLMMYPLP
jgi:hypothetical protein